MVHNVAGQVVAVQEVIAQSSAMVAQAGIPSPSQGVWFVGPVPIRAYALCIVAGILVAVWLGNKRFIARGGPDGAIADVALWAVPFGVVGGRLYHVLSSPAAYFGPGGRPIDALKVWHGGLGIWGAVALGVVGAWIACRKNGWDFRTVLDALAPAVLIAQGIGRLGNYFNQELFGGPTQLPWGLQIDERHRPAAFVDVALFHPTFLYEMLWNFAGAAFLMWAGARWGWRAGQVFWAYCVVYTTGRLWIEAMRVDFAERVFGVRVNIWTSLAVMALGLIGFWWASKHRHRELPVAPAAVGAADHPHPDAGGELDSAPSDRPGL